MKKFIISVLLSTVLTLCYLHTAAYAQDSAAAPPDIIMSLPGWSGALPTRQFSGYITVNATSGARLFYWFIEAQNASADTPIIMYTSGGPGCTSLMSAFLAKGPFHVNVTRTGGFALSQNNHTNWNKVAHMLFVDSPPGTGFSVVPKVEQQAAAAAEDNANLNGIVPSTDQSAADQWIQFMNGFFNLHPEWSNLPIWFSAEGIASKAVTIAAYRAMVQFSNNSTIAATAGGAAFSRKFDIRGIIYESEELNPVLGYLTRVDQAFYSGLISRQQWQQIKVLQPQCIRDIQLGNFNITSSACGMIDLALKLASGGHSLTDVREFGQFPKQPRDVVFAKYLSQPQVQSALHIDNTDFVKEHIPCNPWVEVAYSGDALRPVHYLLPRLLNGGMRIFHMHGNMDMRSSAAAMEIEMEILARWTLPNTTSVEEMHRAMARKFVVVGESIIGYSYDMLQGNFVSVVFHNAGHYISNDRPEHVLTLLNWFIQNVTFASNDGSAILPSILVSTGLENQLLQTVNGTANNTGAPIPMLQPIDSSLIFQSTPQFVEMPLDISGVMCGVLFNNCSGFGSCVNGSCVCDDGYVGTICSFKQDNITTAATASASQQPSQEWYYLKVVDASVLPQTSNASDIRLLVSFTDISPIQMVSDNVLIDDLQQAGGNVAPELTDLFYDLGANNGFVSDRFCLYAKWGSIPSNGDFDAVQCYRTQDLSRAITFYLPSWVVSGAENASVAAKQYWHVGIFNGLRNIQVSYSVAVQSGTQIA